MDHMPVIEKIKLIISALKSNKTKPIEDLALITKIRLCFIAENSMQNTYKQLLEILN